MKQSFYIEAPVQTVFDHFMDPRNDIDLIRKFAAGKAREPATGG